MLAMATEHMLAKVLGVAKNFSGNFVIIERSRGKSGRNMLHAEAVSYTHLTLPTKA